MIFQLLIYLQELQQIIFLQNEWQDTFKISTVNLPSILAGGNMTSSDAYLCTCLIRVFLKSSCSVDVECCCRVMLIRAVLGSNFVDMQ